MMKKKDNKIKDFDNLKEMPEENKDALATPVKDKKDLPTKDKKDKGPVEEDGNHSDEDESDSDAEEDTVRL
jgi:hypothetical protein